MNDIVATTLDRFGLVFRTAIPGIITLSCLIWGTEASGGKAGEGIRALAPFVNLNDLARVAAIGALVGSTLYAIHICVIEDQMVALAVRLLRKKPDFSKMATLNALSDRNLLRRLSRGRWARRGSAATNDVVATQLASIQTNLDRVFSWQILLYVLGFGLILDACILIPFGVHARATILLGVGGVVFASAFTSDLSTTWHEMWISDRFTKEVEL